MPDYDVYAFQKEEDGSYIVTKNGDFFLCVSGGKAEAENIVKTLMKEEEKIHEEVQILRETNCLDQNADR